MMVCLVAHGYEDFYNLKTDFPECSHEAMPLVILTASVINWWVESLDFASVFLQGGMLEREVFLRPPLDVCPESQILKLKRCIYIVNDAPCSWYKRTSHDSTNIKGISNAFDNALFLWQDATGNLMSILEMHVDDFIFCRNGAFQRNVISGLKRISKVGTHENDLVCWFVGFYGISTFECYLTPNLFLCK